MKDLLFTLGNWSVNGGSVCVCVCVSGGGGGAGGGGVARGISLLELKMHVRWAKVPESDARSVTERLVFQMD